MSFTHPHVEWGRCPDCRGPSLRVSGSPDRVCQWCRADPTVRLDLLVGLGPGHVAVMAALSHELHLAADGMPARRRRPHRLYHLIEDPVEHLREVDRLSRLPATLRFAGDAACQEWFLAWSREVTDGSPPDPAAP